MQNHADGLKLLELTKSESDSDSPQFALPKRKVRFKKRFRPNSKAKQAPGGGDACSCQCVQHAKLVLNIIILIIVALLIWFITNLNTRVEDLQKLVDDFKTRNKNTPETFHNIHSDIKLLKSNVTFYGEEIRKISNEIEAISKEVKDLKQITDNLKLSIVAVPEIKKLPQDVKSLLQNVANVGSKVTAVESTVSELKQQQTDLTKMLQDSKDNVDLVKNTLKSVQSYINENMTFRLENLEEKECITKNNLADEGFINDTIQLLINEMMTDSEKHSFLKQNALTYHSLLNITVHYVINNYNQFKNLNVSVENLIRDVAELNKTNTSTSIGNQTYLREPAKSISYNSPYQSSENTTYS